jgi:hypothetical protein
VGHFDSGVRLELSYQKCLCCLSEKNPLEIRTAAFRPNRFRASLGEMRKSLRNEKFSSQCSTLQVSASSSAFLSLILPLWLFSTPPLICFLHVWYEFYGHNLTVAIMSRGPFFISDGMELAGA